MLKQDVELLEGYLIQKMPKSPLHTFICQWLIEAFRKCLPAGLLVRQEQPLSTLDSEPEPDLAVVRGTLADFRAHHPATAELVIEVAISTEEIDRLKAVIYAQAGVREYWMVEPLSRRITVFSSPAGGTYGERREFTGAQTVASGVLPAFTVHLPDLFRS